MYKESCNDVIYNRQKNFMSVDYFLNNMSASSNVGNVRKTQEDAVLLLEHYLNPEIKLLALADGMGGLENGEKASNLSLLLLIQWFLNLPEKTLKKDKELLKMLREQIYIIDDRIRDACERGGTTLSLALVSKTNTIFMNVGDSRSYLHIDGNLVQISNDHSYSYMLYEEGHIENLDDVRFHKKNHLLTSSLGGSKRQLMIEENTLNNKEFDKIILTTDGITDCMSNEEIESVVAEHKNLYISHYLVKKSLSSVSVNNSLDSEFYYNEIEAGKDNSTSACYIRSR